MKLIYKISILLLLCEYLYGYTLQNRNSLENQKMLPGSSASKANEKCSNYRVPFRKRSFNLHRSNFNGKFGNAQPTLPPELYLDFTVPGVHNEEESKRKSLQEKTKEYINKNGNANANEEVDNTEKMLRSPLPRKPNMLPCYICGRLFGISSIYIHEPQCLKKWKIENDQLPPNKRRQEPIRPDIKFTDNKISIEAMNEAYWKTHLSQLVPCNFCRRTFNPDRVEIHERCCKG